MMNEETKQTLEKTKKKIEIANKIRIVFLIFAMLILLCVFWGDKLFAGQAWFLYLCSKGYIAATWSLVIVLAATISKLFLISRYNSILKRDTK